MTRSNGKPRVCRSVSRTPFWAAHRQSSGSNEASPSSSQTTSRIRRCRARCTSSRNKASRTTSTTTWTCQLLRRPKTTEIRITIIKGTSSASWSIQVPLRSRDDSPSFRRNLIFHGNKVFLAPLRWWSETLSRKDQHALSQAIQNKPQMEAAYPRVLVGLSPSQTSTTCPACPMICARDLRNKIRRRTSSTQAT